MKDEVFSGPGDFRREPGSGPPKERPRPPVPPGGARQKELDTANKRSDRAQSKLLPAAQLDKLFPKLGLSEFKPTLFWHDDPVSNRQLRFLKSVGIDGEELSKNAAGHITEFLHARRVQGLATVKQVRLLVRMHHPDPLNASFDAAQAYIATELEKGGFSG
jgi:hypothetical protein